MINIKFASVFFLLVGSNFSKNVSLPEPMSFDFRIPPKLEPLTPQSVEIKPKFSHQLFRALPNSGRLLTPAEGCGISELALRAPRIVGGTPAMNGAWPWMTLLAYKRILPLQHLGPSFNCGKVLNLRPVTREWKFI